MKLLIKENLYDYLLFILVLTLPFSSAIPNVILIIVSFFFIKDLTLQKFKELKFLPIILLFILFIYLAIKAIMFGTFFIDVKFYKGYFLVILLFIVFQKVKDLNKLKIFILIGISIMVTASFFLIGNYYIHYNILPFANTEEVNDLLILERPYAGFMAVLGFFLSLEFMKILPKQKNIFVVNTIIMIVFVFLISARLSILTILFIISIYLLFFYKIKFYKKLISLFILLVFFCSSLVLNKNIAHRFFIKDDINKSLEVASNYEPRIVIWNCANEMTRKVDFSAVFGFDSYNKISNNYLECYESTIQNLSKQNYFLTTKFNSHNQFIDFFLIGGLTALFLLIGFFSILLYFARNDFFELSFLISIVLFFMVENVLYRQFGCYIFSIFVVILVMKKPIINDKN